MSLLLLFNQAQRLPAGGGGSAKKKKKYTVQHKGQTFAFDTVGEAQQAVRQMDALDRQAVATAVAAIAASPPEAAVQGAPVDNSAQYAAILAMFDQIEQDEQDEHDIEMLLLSL